MSNTCVDTDQGAVRALRSKLEDYHRQRARQAGWVRRFVPTALEALDRALPQRGIPNGAVAEVLADHPGIGALSLSMRIAGQCLRGWGGNVSPICPCIIFVDIYGDFYPPAILRWGIDLKRLVVIRPSNAKEAFWAIDQSLRCSAVAAVIAPLDRLDERQSRRLQLAAESNGCVGIILRSARSRGKSFAAVRLLLEGVAPQEILGGSLPLPHGHGSVWMPHPCVGGNGTCATVNTTPVVERAATSHSKGGERMNMCQTYGTRTSAPAEVGGSLSGHGSDRVPSITFGSEQYYRLHDTFPCRITILSVREGMPAGPILVDLHHETGALPVHPISVDRCAARSVG